MLVFTPFFSNLRLTGPLLFVMGIRVLVLMGSISHFQGGFDLFKDDIRIMFEQFHQFASLPHGFSSFFVISIHKYDSSS